MENSRVSAVGDYSRKLAVDLVNAGDMKGIFSLGTAWGVYSAIEILDGDFHMDADLKQKFIEKYIGKDKETYFSDFVRVHKS